MFNTGQSYEYEKRAVLSQRDKMIMSVDQDYLARFQECVHIICSDLSIQKMCHETQSGYPIGQPRSLEAHDTLER